jgi:hypothetical protein
LTRNQVRGNNSLGQTSAAPRAGSSRYRGRHHPGIPGRNHPVLDGRLHRNRHLEDAAEELARHEEPFAGFLCAAMRQTADEYEREGNITALKATAFWTRYADLCLQEFPDLRMSRLRAVRMSNDLRPRFLANTLPPGVRLEHKASKGHVDLTFQKRDARDLAEKFGDLLPHGVCIFSARRSAIVRAVVPRLAATNPFEPRQEAVCASLDALRQLAKLLPEVCRRMGYEPKLRILQEPLNHIPRPASNLLHSRRFFRK